MALRGDLRPIRGLKGVVRTPPYGLWGSSSSTAGPQVAEKSGRPPPWRWCRYAAGVGTRTPVVWFDDEPLEARWAPPSRSRKPRWWVTALIITVALALATGVVAAFGGLDRWRGRFPVLATPSTITTGPLEVTFTRAIARKPAYSDKWEVSAYGTCRNVSANQENLITIVNAAFIARLAGDSESHAPRLMTYASYDSRLSSTNLNPGLAPQPCLLDFAFRGDVPITNYLELGIFMVEWTDPSLTQSGEKQWYPTDEAYRFYLPLVILPSD